MEINKHAVMIIVRGQVAVLGAGVLLSSIGWGVAVVNLEMAKELER